MRFGTMAAIGLALAATPAFAQDSAEEDGFDGPYIGGTFGYGVQSNDGRETILFDTNGDGVFGDQVSTTAGANAFSPGFCGGRANGNSFASGCTGDDDDLEYYLHAGWDTQFDSGIVAGVVLEGGKADIKDGVTAFSTTPASYTFQRSLRYNGTLRGRFGYTPNNTTLFYGTGGLAYGKVRNRFATTNTANAFSNNGNSDAYGWTAGGGVEQKLTPNVSIGLNYLYTNLDDDEFQVDVDQGTAPATNPFVLVSPNGTDFRRSDTDFDWHSIRVTASLRF